MKGHRRVVTSAAPAAPAARCTRLSTSSLLSTQHLLEGSLLLRALKVDRNCLDAQHLLRCRGRWLQTAPAAGHRPHPFVPATTHWRPAWVAELHTRAPRLASPRRSRRGHQAAAREGAPSRPPRAGRSRRAFGGCYVRRARAAPLPSIQAPHHLPLPLRAARCVMLCTTRRLRRRQSPSWRRSRRGSRAAR